MMPGKSTVRIVFLASSLFVVFASTCSVAADAEDRSGFRDVLTLAELGPEILAKFSGTSNADIEGRLAEDWQVEDWQLLIQLLYRLGQYSAAQQAEWALPWSESSKLQLGDLVDVVGTVETVEILTRPQSVAQAHGLKSLYRCQFRFGESAEGQSDFVGTVLAARIPSGWQIGETLAEPIRFRGILLRSLSDDSQTSVLFLTPRLAWYPCRGVPRGQLLLAQHGMDLALLEEVKHREPFVGPEVSREGEAFYACLAAMSRVDSGELSTLSQQSVVQAADHWREPQPAEGQRRAIAAQVLQRSELGLSSVAPMFLQPEQMIGRLVRIEGIARRAVRIAVADQPELDSYFELEIFPPDSQNLPVVCCVKELPAEFPTGDAIREPVCMAGVFLKSWQYRDREVQPIEGETGRQQRMYTPVVVGAVEWLPRSAGRQGLWGLWGGISFLVVLMIVVLNAVRLARRDRHARAARRHPEGVDLPLDSPTSN